MEKKYIIIANDDINLRTALKDLIKSIRKDVMIMEACDGADVLRKIKLQKFFLSIIDIKMSKFDGASVVASIDILPSDFKPENIWVMSDEEFDEQFKSHFPKKVQFYKKPIDDKQIIEGLNLIFGKSEKKKMPDPGSFDISIVNAFINATIQVLDTMAQTPSRRDSLYLKDPNQSSGDISALLSIHSSSHRGSLAISFEKKCFLGICERMLGEKFSDINSENSDTVAELCNQIFGVAKVKINESGNNLQPAIPSIITGESHSIQHKTNGACIVVKFATDIGDFTIETIMEKVSNSSENAAA